MREMLPHLFLVFPPKGEGDGKLCTYCHFSYAKHFVSAANLIICSILAPSDAVAEGVEVGGSVEKRRPVLQSVQLNDFNARFFGRTLGTCHLAR